MRINTHQKTLAKFALMKVTSRKDTVYTHLTGNENANSCIDYFGVSESGIYLNRAPFHISG